MSKFMKTALLVLIVLMIGVVGCRKQVSTLQDVSSVPVDSTFKDPQPFAYVDTTDEAIFREAQLADELDRKVREMLTPVYFEYNSYQLTSQSLDHLAEIGVFLKENSGLRVLIQGHCDERGSSEYNMGLGERRSRAVKDYLQNYGLMPIRIEITSLGKEQPAIAGCADEECHSKNRRSEFKVLAR